MPSKKFQRRTEDFVCEHCGTAVQGTGYTNHCPKCLWSKHVDIHPGDREADCGGMMRPVTIEGGTPHYRVLQRCEKCGFERRNNLSNIDNSEAIIAIVRATTHSQL